MAQNYNKQDSLLASLIEVCNLLHCPQSPHTLTAGLPLIENRLTPNLFIRACERAGLTSSLVNRPLEEIPESVLPCVLLLQDQQAVVLKDIDYDPQGSAIAFNIYDPSKSTSDPLQTVEANELKALYQGQCLYIKQSYSPSDDKASQEDTKHWLKNTLKFSKNIYRDVIIASLMINLFVLANPLFVMNVYDRVVPNNAEETLWVLATGVAIVFGFDLLIKSLRSHFIEVAGKKLDIILSARLFQKAIGIHFQHLPRSVGAFAQNIREFDHVRNFFSSVTITTLVDFPFAILFILVIASLGGMIALAPLTAALFILCYGFIKQRPLQKAIEQSQSAYAQKSSNLIESIQSLETVRVFNAEGQRQSQWEDNVSFLSSQQVEIKRLSNAIQQMSGFVTQITGVIVVIIGAYQITEHEMSMGALIACVLLASRAVAPMAQAANLIAQYEQTKQSVESLNQMLTLPQDQPVGKKYIYRQQFEGNVELKQVSFNYPDQKQPTLNNINLKIQSGEKVALIGRIGSGKSTLGKLLMGLYSPSQGQILFDGLDQQQINPSDCRNNIAYVPQEIQVFSGDLRQNIAIKAPFIPDEEVLRVADISLLSEFANHHPEGYSLTIGERGEGLSGGQKQQLAIARALVNDPPIVFMDECTSAMDNQSEQAIIKQFETHLQDKTLILSTHRASLLKLVDRIIVLEQGHIIADGPKAQVMDALKRGLLRAPVQEQNG